MNPQRPLPARLRLDGQLETWVPVSQTPGVLDWATRFRVKPTSGDVIKSRLNKSVPAAGYVAGGGETPYGTGPLTTITTSASGAPPSSFEVWNIGAGPSTSASAVYEPAPDNEPED